MKKCGHCGLSTVDDSYEYCYLCGTRLASATAEHAACYDRLASPATYFKCAECGTMADYYMPHCMHCGGEIIPLVNPDTTITPPVGTKRSGEVNRCTACSYSTDNLSYRICPKCAFPLAVAFADTPHVHQKDMLAECTHQQPPYPSDSNQQPRYTSSADITPPQEESPDPADFDSAEPDTSSSAIDAGVTAENLSISSDNSSDSDTDNPE